MNEVKRYVVSGYEYDIGYENGGECPVEDWPDEALVRASDFDRLSLRLEQLRPHAKWLRMAAAEIAKEGHAGWGNTCLQAAHAIESALTAEQVEGKL